MSMQGAVNWEGRIKAIKQEVIRIRDDVNEALEKKFIMIDRRIERM